MARVVFLVHGMGTFIPGWHADITGTLDTAAAQYEFFKHQTLSEQVTFVPITYDDVFSEHQRQVGDSASAVADFVKANPTKVDKALTPSIKWLTGAGSDAFVWANVADVVAYRFFPTVRAQVQAQVLAQITDTVAQAKNAAKATGDTVEFSLIAHSLGTAVTHDALEMLGTTVYTAKDKSNTSQYLAKNGNWLTNLFMIANVGQVLETLWPVTGKTCVRPGSSGAGAYCDQYFNVQHSLDPIPAVCPFAPSGWGDGYTKIDNIDHLAQINVHGWTHYLRHPDVHVPIFRALFGSKAVSQTELDATRTAFLAGPSDVCHGALSSFHAALSDLAGQKARCTPDDFLKTLVAYCTLASKAAVQCGQTITQLSL